jgi:xylulokinase
VDATVARVSGGGARSDLWLRIVAAVLDVPLERTEVEDGAAFGAALLGAVAAGVFADAAEAVAACVRVVERIEPDAVWRDLYAGAYERYVTLYPTLRPLEER